jgi:hypothetical protein
MDSMLKRELNIDKENYENYFKTLEKSKEEEEKGNKEKAYSLMKKAQEFLEKTMMLTRAKNSLEN